MIPKMIEKVHFNDDKPNKNIALTDKKDNKIKFMVINGFIKTKMI